MKKLYLLSVLLLMAFVLIYSCSTEEEDTTPPPSVVATPEPEPQPTQYTLTVSAGEGGSVSTEGGTYDEGTEITITATPEEGYEFVGWEGSDSDSDSLTVTLNGNNTFQAVFQKKFYFIVKNEIIHSEFITKINDSYNDFNTAALLQSNSNGTNYLDYNGAEFLVFPGIASCVGTEDGCQNVNNITQIQKLPSVIFRKNNFNWEFDNYDENGAMYSARNSEIFENFILISDANEIGPNSFENRWRGPLILGEVRENRIYFRTITSEEEYGFYHDASLGDLNDDGKLDIVATLYNGSADYGDCSDSQMYPPGFAVFFQNQNGQFQMNNSIIEYPVLENCEPLFKYPPLAIASKDLDGDNIAEIITYTSNNLLNGDTFNNITILNNPVVIYKFNEDKKKFEYIPNTYFIEPRDYDSGAISIDIYDLNNDNLEDIIVKYENSKASGDFLDIWHGRGNNKFEFKSTIKSNGKPSYFDLNSDGFIDFAVTTRTRAPGKDFYIDGQFSQGVPCPTYKGDPNCLEWMSKTKNGGINFNSFIYLNNGDGNFNKFQNDLIIKDVVVDWLIPYVKNRKLHFVGINGYDEKSEDGFDVNRKIKYGEEMDNHVFTVYDIELNIFE